ncbi:hypothetical protein QBC45DRAFT_433250 [Copromyces sp. CBS 386.78]|nr:hypothetical protein QBC45DRAFT_433250 [Copromyces sp. CBS 386.78]
MEPWVQEQAMIRSLRPAPLDDRASYQTWKGVFNGQYINYHHPAALFPERYAPNSGASPWHCPVLGCGAVHQFSVELAGHFTYAHRGVTLCDNRNGTFTILRGEEQADPRGYAYVAAQRQILAGPRASFPFATPGPEHADDNQGNGVADAADGSESEAWRDSGISMMSTSDEDSSGEEGGEEDEGSDDDEDDDTVMGDADDDSDGFPEETMVIPNARAIGQTPGDGASSAADGNPMDVNSSQAPRPAAQAAISPVTFPGLQLRPLHNLQPRQELPDPTPLQTEIWPYITRWTLYPLPLPSPFSPSHRTLLALLRFPRIRSLPVSWQERLRARTPSLGTLTAIALYLGGRAESGSPCQSHCGQYGALVERLFAVQREKAWEEGSGQWKLEKKFAFPREMVRIPVDKLLF